jgi:hypothetical protein
LWIKLDFDAAFGGHEGFGREGALFAFGGGDLPSAFARIAQPKEIIRGGQHRLEAYIICQLITIAYYKREMTTI